MKKRVNVGVRYTYIVKIICSFAPVLITIFVILYLQVEMYRRLCSTSLAVNKCATGTPWTDSELILAVHSIRVYGKDFKAVARLIGNKTEAQVRLFFANYRERYDDLHYSATFILVASLTVSPYFILDDASLGFTCLFFQLFSNTIHNQR